jgi:hypothetical protein
MNLQQILHHRDALLRQARLANTAFAYVRLGEFAARIARARLRGAVALRAGDPAGDHPWPGLAALEGSQAVLEEHFLDEEIVELTDILRFIGEDLADAGLTLRLEELAARYLPRLRRDLEAAGVAVPTPPALESPGTAAGAP